MSKYAIVNCVNGNFLISSEHETKESAIIAFHNRSAALWNASDVISASVTLFDDNLYVIDGRYTERISHPEPEPEPILEVEE